MPKAKKPEPKAAPPKASVLALVTKAKDLVQADHPQGAVVVLEELEKLLRS
jgi:hypothetical protein